MRSSLIILVLALVVVLAQDRPDHQKEPKKLPWQTFGPDSQKGQGDWGADFGPKDKKGKPDAAGGGTQPWAKYIPGRPGAEKHSHQMDSDGPQQGGDWQQYPEKFQPGASKKGDKNSLPWDTYGPKPPSGVHQGPESQQGSDWQKYVHPGSDKKDKDSQGQNGGFDWQKYVHPDKKGNDKDASGFDWKKYLGDQEKSKDHHSKGKDGDSGFDWQKYAGGQDKDSKDSKDKTFDWQKYVPKQSQGQGGDDWQKYAGGNQPQHNQRDRDDDEREDREERDDRRDRHEDEREREREREQRERERDREREPHRQRSPHTQSPPPMMQLAENTAAAPLDAATVQAQTEQQQEQQTAAAPAEQKPETVVQPPTAGLSWLWVLPLGVTFMLAGALIDRKLHPRGADYSAIPQSEV